MRRPDILPGLRRALEASGETPPRDRVAELEADVCRLREALGRIRLLCQGTPAAEVARVALEGPQTTTTQD